MEGLLSKIWIKCAKLGLLNFMSDSFQVGVQYFLNYHRKINLRNPVLFSEKLNYLKLNDHKKSYSKMVDKIEMKKFVKDRIGEGHTVPTVAVFSNIEQIEMEKLPDSFVIKCNHDSHSSIICKDKSDFNLKKTKKILKKHLRKNYYFLCREWPYKNVKKKILVEPLLVEPDSDENALTDYKFFCFNGVPLFMYIGKDTSSHPTNDFYDMSFKQLDFYLGDPPSGEKMKIPSCFSTMIEYARKLSQNIPFLRVDFYYISGKIYVGELTFYHSGGYPDFHPQKYDEILGKKLDIISVQRGLL